MNVNAVAYVRSYCVSWIMPRNRLLAVLVLKCKDHRGVSCVLTLLRFEFGFDCRIRKDSDSKNLYAIPLVKPQRKKNLSCCYIDDPEVYEPVFGLELVSPMGPFFHTRHSSHGIATQPVLHRIRAGVATAKMASMWMPWRNAHCPHSLSRWRVSCAYCYTASAFPWRMRKWRVQFSMDSPAVPLCVQIFRFHYLPCCLDSSPCWKLNLSLSHFIEGGKAVL